MAGTDSYGSMFHTLANRFKQHDSESNARASAQADISKSTQPINTTRRPSYVGQEARCLHKCPHCHLLRWTSTVSSASSGAQSPTSHHTNDERFGNFCPDIAVPSHMDPHEHPRHHHRRPTLLADKDRDSSEDSSTSSASSPALRQSKLGSVEQRHARKCQCGSIKPTEDMEPRYGRE